MNHQEHLVTTYQLQPADAVMLRKKFAGMFNHYAVYLGRDSETNQPLFAANYTRGVKIISEKELEEFLEILEPERIERFHGSWQDRLAAVGRAWKWLGKTGYNLIFNNCQHYKNFVQDGEAYSEQVDDIGTGLMIAVGATAIVGALGESKGALGIGLLALALGAVVKSGANQS